MANDILKKFGKFFLLDRIAQGGMAEIYRARLAGEGGAGRILVIKRIQAGYGSNKEFQEMFKSEIQVTMGFNHPNIVQVYDFGEESSQAFIAMELVDGRNLRQLITESRNRNQKIPIDLAAYIIEQSCAGLNYAHTFKDKVTGQPYHIIHRDISPQNIIASYDGVIKVIDFGIAKANVERENTRAGVIKGKPSYLSPEQVVGEALDARSDVFSLGIVLWELLTGVKLFKAKSNDNEFVVLKMIESCATYVKPPSRFNDQVPPELDEIVMKSLAKSKGQRYQNADDFRKALRKFLANYSPQVGNSELSVFMKRLFQNIIVKDRKNLQELNQKAERLLQDGTKIPHVSTTSSAPSIQIEASKNVPEEGTMTFRSFTEREKQFEFNDPTLDKSKMTAEGVLEVEKKRLKQSFKVSSPNSPPPYSGARNSGTRTMQRSQLIQKQKKSSPLLKVGVFIFGSLLVGAFLYGPKKFKLNIPMWEMARHEVLSKFGVEIAKNDEIKPPTETVETPDNQNDTAEKIAGKLKVKYSIYPEWGKEAIAYINGKPVNMERDFLEIPYDTQYSLKIIKPGFKLYEKNEYYSSSAFSSVSEHKVNVLLVPEKHGFLTIKTFPNADITIVPTDRSVAQIFQGEKEVKWTHSSPVEHLQLPVGTYKVKLQNDILGLERVISVVIEEDRETAQNVNLEQR